MTAGSKTGFDAPHSYFPAFKPTSSGVTKGNCVTSPKTPVITSTNTTPEKNITN